MTLTCSDQETKTTDLCGKKVTHTRLNLNLKFTGKQDKQDKHSNLPSGDWRDAVVVGWSLVLKVAGEKDVVNEG